MNDDVLALELTKLNIQSKGVNIREDVINTYYYYLKEIQEKEEDNRIGEIRRIFRNAEGRAGSWCGISGINMLRDIESIVKGNKNEPKQSN